MTEEEMWRAVLARDGAADGAFVYAVRSTKIYCRPGCPSRRPGRGRVSFFPTPAAAETAGYRACRRCRPQADGDGEDRRLALVRRVCARIDAAEGERVTLAELGAEIGLSPHHLQRSFKQVMGISPAEYADARRLGRLKSRLRGGDTVAGALYEAGYGASSRLYERAPALLGMTPGAFRKRGAGETVRYGTAGCALGRLLVAATDRGVCFLAFGSDEAALAAELAAEFPAAAIRRDDDGLGALLAPVLAHLAGEAPMPTLPLDLRATAFQRRVWEALRRIPPGETRTYGQLAREIGKPGAARAVGRACATNPVSLLVPCHRAVREDGGLGGYRWGIERKRALIEKESGERRGR